MLGLSAKVKPNLNLTIQPSGMDLYVTEGAATPMSPEGKTEGGRDGYDDGMPRMENWCGLSSFLPYSIVMDVIQSR